MKKLTEEDVRRIFREELAKALAGIAQTVAAPSILPTAQPWAARPWSCPVCGVVGCMTTHVTCGDPGRSFVGEAKTGFGDGASLGPSHLNTRVTFGGNMSVPGVFS